MTLRTQAGGRASRFSAGHRVRPTRSTRDRRPVELLEARRLLAAIASGETLAGNLTSLGQVDDYTFNVAANTRVFAALSRTSMSAEMRLRIVSPSGASLFDMANLFGVHAEFVATESGVYTLRASDLNDDELGGYNISMVRVPGSHTSDGDDGPFVSGAAVEGTIALGDIDVFPFAANAGEPLTIALSRAGSAIEPRLDVIGPDGGLVQGQSTSFGLLAEFSPTFTGIHHAVVRDLGADEAGAYRISFARPSTPAVSTLLGGGQYGTQAVSEGQLRLFRFNVPQAGADVRLGMSRTSGGIEPRAKVYAPGGAEVAAGSNTFGFTLDFNATVAGEYVVVAGDVNADEAGAFGISVAVGGAAPANDRGPLVSGQQVRSRLELGMLETFTFSGAAGETVFFASSRVNSALEPRLDIFRPDGVRLATESGTFGFNLQAVLPLSGTYLAVASDVSADEAGAYHLSMVRSIIGAGQQVGPLLGDQEGGLLQSGEGRRGFLDLADLDVYTIQAQAGDRILAAMGRESGGHEPLLLLFGPGGAVVASNTGTFAAAVEAPAPSTGTYVLVAGDQAGDEQGTYTLSLAVGRRPVAADPADADGGTLVAGQPKFGSLTLADSDVYTFDATAGSAFTLRMSRRTPGSVGPNLYLYAPDGSRQFAGGTFDATLAVASAPATGTYTVVAADSGFDNTGGYAISLDAVLPAADTTPPAALLGALEVLRSGSVQVVFSEPVINLTAASLTLNNLTTGGTVSATGVTFNANTNTATFAVTGGLPDGNYAATLGVGDIRDQSNNLLSGPLNFEFFVFRGDANRDRAINIADFSILAANFNQIGTFGEGDFNYDGNVTIADFSILASKFNATLPAARPGVIGDGALPGGDQPAAKTPFAVRRIIESIDFDPA